MSISADPDPLLGDRCRARRDGSRLDRPRRMPRRPPSPRPPPVARWEGALSTASRASARGRYVASYLPRNGGGPTASSGQEGRGAAGAHRNSPHAATATAVWRVFDGPRRMPRRPPPPPSPRCTVGGSLFYRLADFGAREILRRPPPTERGRTDRLKRSGGGAEPPERAPASPRGSGPASPTPCRGCARARPSRGCAGGFPAGSPVRRRSR